MKIWHYFKKLMLHLKTDGFKNTMKETIFFNRVMVVIEKEISPTDYNKNDDYKYAILDKDNYENYFGDSDIIKNVEYYCKNGATCLLAFQGNTLFGYQLWTYDNNFKDVKQLSIQLGADEAYLFDFFVFPEFRGTDIPKMITYETFNHLISKGINKIYGFYFTDNVKSLWWHKAFLKCKEIKRVKIHRILLFELANGRITLNL